MKPFDEMVGISDTSAQDQEVWRGRQQSECQFIAETAHIVAEHLVYIGDKQSGTEPFEKLRFLRFESGDDDFCIEIFREISGGDSDIPAAFAPFEKFVICEGPCRHSENCLPVEAGFHQKFEDVGFPCTGRSMHDNIFTITEIQHCLLLPGSRELNVDIR